MPAAGAGAHYSFTQRPVPTHARFFLLLPSPGASPWCPPTPPSRCKTSPRPPSGATSTLVPIHLAWRRRGGWPSPQVRARAAIVAAGGWQGAAWGRCLAVTTFIRPATARLPLPLPPPPARPHLHFLQPRGLCQRLPDLVLELAPPRPAALPQLCPGADWGRPLGARRLQGLACAPVATC